MNEAAAHSTPGALDQSSRGLPIWSPRGSEGKFQFVSAGDLQAGWEQWCLRCAGEAVGTGVDDGRGRQARVMVAIARDLPEKPRRSSAGAGGERPVSGGQWIFITPIPEDVW
jgi:hypothetical protein